MNKDLRGQPPKLYTDEEEEETKAEKFTDLCPSWMG